MRKTNAIFLILAVLALLPLIGCQGFHKNGETESRDVKADRELAAKKPVISGQAVSEILTEPQSGFIQEPAPPRED